MTLPPRDETTPSSEELNRLVMAVATEQDRQAFALVFRHFGPRVKTYLVRLGITPNMAEEIAQETMLAVWRRAASFDPSRGSAATWIFTVARNLFIDQKRRNRRPGELDPDPSDEPDLPRSTEAALIAAEREASVRRALGALSKEQSAIVDLSFFGDKTHAEIARELGIPLGTVKSRVRLALSHLRSLVDDAT